MHGGGVGPPRGAWLARQGAYPATHHGGVRPVTKMCSLLSLPSSSRIRLDRAPTPSPPRTPPHPLARRTAARARAIACAPVGRAAPQPAGVCGEGIFFYLNSYY